MADSGYRGVTHLLIGIFFVENYDEIKKNWTGCRVHHSRPLDSPMGRCLSGPIVLSALSTIWDVYLNMIFVEWQMIKLEHGKIK